MLVAVLKKHLNEGVGDGLPTKELAIFNVAQLQWSHENWYLQIEKSYFNFFSMCDPSSNIFRFAYQKSTPFQGHVQLVQKL